MLKPKGAPAVKIKLTEINEMQNFTDCTKFFGAKMYDTHSSASSKPDWTAKYSLFSFS